MNASGHSAWQKCVGISDMHQLLSYWTESAAEPLSKNIKMNLHSLVLSQEKFNIHTKMLESLFEVLSGGSQITVYLLLQNKVIMPG